MALRVEIKTETLKQALDTLIASHKRALNTAKNPAFRPIYEKDIAELEHAKATVQEIK